MLNLLRSNMNATQTYLTNLLLEIDEICKKYDIEYFVDYGSALGAIRHEGFIPWDDDIDVTMTEDNYYKWVQACKKELDPAKRVYSDCRLDPEFPGVFGRYVDVESMRLSDNFKFWEPVCGQSIDVFYLIELPGDPVKKQEAIDRYFVYDEYSNGSYRHYRRKTPRQWALYEQCLKLEKRIGRKKVLKRLEEQIFHKHYEDCDTYIVSSARTLGPTSIVPKYCYDSVCMADFEGHKLPVPGRYAELLTIYYGDDWDIIPDHGKSHSKMSHTEINCDDYVSDYMRLINKRKMLRERRKFKELSVEEGVRTGNRLKEVNDKLKSFELLRINRRIKEKDVSPLELCKADDNEALSVLDFIFNDYYIKQLDHSTKYWKYYFDIGDDLLYCALFNLIYNRNDIASAAKIISLREYNGFKIDGKIGELQSLIISVRRVKAQLVYKNYKEAQGLVCGALQRYPHCRELAAYKLMLDIISANSSGDLDACEQYALALLEKYPGFDKYIKALGDIALARKDFDEAEKQYNHLLKNSKNGMILLDIKKKMKEIK